MAFQVNSTDSIEIGSEDVVEEASKVSDILSEGFGNRRTD